MAQLYTEINFSQYAWCREHLENCW